MKKSIITTVILIFLVGLAIYGCKYQKPKPKADIGAEAADFALKNYDGSQVKLSDYKGKIVVLEWFNYECPFVKAHYEKANTMTTLADKYKDKQIVWLAVNSTSHAQPAKNKEFADKHNIPYPILEDNIGSVGRSYAAKTTPHIFIIDKAGKIAYNGAIDNAPLGDIPAEGLVNYVDNALSELTAGATITIAKTKPYGCSVKYAD